MRSLGSSLEWQRLALTFLFFTAALMETVALICSLPLLLRLPIDLKAGQFVGLTIVGPAFAMGILALLNLG